MNKNKKTLISISIAFAFLPFLILPSLLFINNKPKQLNLVRPSGFDVFDNLNNDKETKTKSILNKLVDDVFRNFKAEQQKFVKDQNDNKSQLLEKSKELSDKYLLQPNEQNLKTLKQFYSENWLFLLLNLEKFELKFIDFWKLESKDNKAHHSSQFLETIKNKPKPKENHIFTDNNLDLIKTGKENEDLSGHSAVYLKKDKFIIRTTVKNNSKILEIDKFILFNESEINRINIDTISDAIHLGVFHNQSDAFTSTFEKHIVGNYGYPWDGILVLKEQKNV
ncbi:aromatic motif membrane protein [Mycoplasma capricolum]|uniref:aromatic motif membrane protein n=1 Tax=Mycoplasma capricolum TaxID=2095 RepID=UPI003DA4A6B2